MSWLDSLFGTKNPSKDAMKYLSQIPGQTQQYQRPWIEAGQGMLGGLSDQYNQLMGDPSGRLNQIGAGYKESPGFQNALKQALAASGHAQAAGGMAGTPQHQWNDMDQATGLASKDYNDYMHNALGVYGMGLEGGQHMADQGMQAGNNISDMIAQMLAQQGAYSYAGAASQNQNRNALWGNLFKGIGGAMGGPLGAMAGGAFSNMMPGANLPKPFGATSGY
jgi:hypothetical protein